MPFKHLTDTLDEQFQAPVGSRVLVLDADGAAYRAAATAKTLPTAVRRFVTEVLEYKYLTNAEHCNVHLTASDSLKAHRERIPAFRPYQGNRDGKSRPALLEPLRLLLADPTARSAMQVPEDFQIVYNTYWEADDTVMQDSYRYKGDSVIVSDDKDLRMTPYPYYDRDTGSILLTSDNYGEVWLRESGALGGHGLKVFFAQMLMGDTADHIRGLDRLYGKLCGPVTALEFLEDTSTEQEAASKVLWAYAHNKQDALAEAELLWMRRTVTDSAYQYLTELDLGSDLQAWLDQLRAYHIRYFEYHYPEYKGELNEA